MFFKTKKKESEIKHTIIPKVQTAEGWKRMLLKKCAKWTRKKRSAFPQRFGITMGFQTFQRGFLCYPLI